MLAGSIAPIGASFVVGCGVIAAFVKWIEGAFKQRADARAFEACAARVREIDRARDEALREDELFLTTRGFPAHRSPEAA
jgi:hypothetical protein